MHPPRPPLSRRALLHATLGAGLLAAGPLGRALAAPPPVEPPPGAAPYVPRLPPTAGAHLQHCIRALHAPPDPLRPFVIWALGSSYANALGNGRGLAERLRAANPKLPPVVWRQDVGSGVPYQFLEGRAEGGAIPGNPDLVLLYAAGEAKHLDRVLRRIRAATSADIVVPTLHWREQDSAHWGKDEDGAETAVSELRATAAAHGAELLEHRAEWARYLTENKLPMSALLKDKAHQSPYGAWMLQALLAEHLLRPLDPKAPQRATFEPIDRLLQPGEALQLEWTGQRLDLALAPGQGALRVRVDDRDPAAHRAFVQGPTERGPANASPNQMVPRDVGPHGLQLDRPDQLQAERIDVEVIDQNGHYTVQGSRSGRLGTGRSTEGFTATDGRLSLPADWWRRPNTATQGDRYTVQIDHAVAAEVSAAFVRGEPRHTPRGVELRLATGLPAGKHTVRLEATGAPVKLRGLWTHRFG